MSSPIQNVGYGLTNALQGLSPQPIVSNRNPGVRDTAELGTVWVNKSTDSYWILTSVVAGAANWQAQGGGAGTFTSVEITGGGNALVVDVGDVQITEGTLTVGGVTTLDEGLNVTGAVGITGSVNFTGDLVVDAITGITLEGDDITISIQPGDSGTVNVCTDSVANSLNLGTGAGPKNVVLGSDNSSSSLSLLSGSGGITIDSKTGILQLLSEDTTGSDIQLNALGTGGGIIMTTDTGGFDLAGLNGPFTLTTGTGAIAISDDANATTIGLGNGAAAKTITIGSTNSTSSTTVHAGSGAIALSAAGLVSVVPGTVSGSSTTPTLSKRVGVATVTGLTTAAAASATITITNTFVTTTSAVLVSASNLDASGNHARVAVSGVNQGANTLLVQITNNGAGALGAGDNVLVSFWILS